MCNDTIILVFLYLLDITLTSHLPSPQSLFRYTFLYALSSEQNDSLLLPLILHYCLKEDGDICVLFVPAFTLVCTHAYVELVVDVYKSGYGHMCVHIRVTEKMCERES